MLIEPSLRKKKKLERQAGEEIECWEILKEIISEVSKETLGVEWIRGNRKRHPHWWTANVRMAVKKQKNFKVKNMIKKNS